MSSRVLSPDDAVYRREVTWRGAFALFAQRMGQDARSWKFHLALTLAIFLLFSQASLSSVSFAAFGAPGLAYLKTWGNISFFLIFIGGVSYFVRIISEEKEQGTLALLKLTGIGPFGILSGLFGSRLAQILVVFALQLPFILWSVTLGGVTLHQVLAMFLTLLSTLFLVGSVALFSAVLTRGTLAANGFCYFLLLTPLFAYGGLNWVSLSIENGGLVFSGAMQVRWFCEQGMAFLSAVSPHHQFVAIMSTGYAEPLFNLQVVCSFAAGFALFVVSVGIFDWFSRQTEPAPLVSGSGWNIFRRTQMERKSERCWDNPYLWREFQFRKQGARGLLVSLLAAFGMSWFLFAVLPFLLELLGYAKIDVREHTVSLGMIWLWATSLATCLISPLAIGTILVGELKQQTFGTLFLVAREPREILRGLIAGKLLLLLHLIIWLAAGIAGCLFWQPETFRAMSSAYQPGFWSVPAIFLTVVAYLTTTFFFGLYGIRASLIRTPLRKQMLWYIAFLFGCPPCTGGPVVMMLLSPIYVASILIFNSGSSQILLPVFAGVLVYLVMGLTFSVIFWQDSLSAIRDRMSDD